MPTGHAPEVDAAAAAAADAATAADAAAAVAEDVLRALRRILQGTTLHSRQMFRKTGLTMPQYLCLRSIASTDAEAVTAAMVARQVRLSPATVTGILDRLERAQLIVRERHSRDRRRICLSVTPLGHERIATVSPSLQDRFVERLERLGAAERRAILDALNRVVDMIDASNLDASPILDAGDVSSPER